MEVQGLVQVLVQEQGQVQEQEQEHSRMEVGVEELEGLVLHMALVQELE